MRRSEVIGRPLATVVLVLGAASCSSSDRSSSTNLTAASSGAPPTVLVPTSLAGMDPSTSLVGASTDAVVVPSTGCCDPGPSVLVTAVSAQHLPGFDRIVFQFEAPLRSYHVRYVSLPVTRDPSDLPVELPGDHAIQVSMGATSIDQRVTPPRVTYDGPLRIPVGEGPVLELVQTGDFEAVSNWTVATRGQPPMRVSAESNPPRLVIDVASP